ncbi:MAG: hypothetical protein H6647_14420 [Anaerolineales bacterium]|nr:hypothetical protein [Anaerolineales bacterium]
MSETPTWRGVDRWDLAYAFPTPPPYVDPTYGFPSLESLVRRLYGRYASWSCRASPGVARWGSEPAAGELRLHLPGEPAQLISISTTTSRCTSAG